MGWIHGIDRLIDRDLDRITIKFKAAVGIAWAGTALLLHALEPEIKRIIGWA